MMPARNSAIDILRAVAILLVLLTHQYEAPDHLRPLAGNGYYGVVIFFVISGFLITTNTLHRYGEPSRINLAQFYLMRAGRILPSLMLFIVVMLAMILTGWDRFVPPSAEAFLRMVLAALTFTFNYFYGETAVYGLSAWAPLWSLAIEEQFYLVFPLVCVLTRHTRVFVLVLVCVVAFGPYSRATFGNYLTPSAVDLLALGCLTALFVRAVPNFLKRSAVPTALKVLGASTIGCIVALCSAQTDVIFTPSLLGAATAVFLVGAAAAPSSSPVPILSAVGRASYEIYIMHMLIYFLIFPLMEPVIAHFGASGEAAHALAFGLLLVADIAIGTLLFRYFSEPLNQAIREHRGFVLASPRSNSEINRDHIAAKDRGTAIDAAGRFT